MFASTPRRSRRFSAEAADPRAGCTCGGFSRRAVLGGLAAGLGGLSAGSGVSVAQAAEKRIDVHAHLSPPTYIADLGPKSFQPPALTWTPQRHLEEMEKAGVTHSILSIGIPGPWVGYQGQGRRLARETNDYGARLRADHPNLGLFATIPLPDTDGSLAEIAYGLDELKADGIGLFTSYADKWLGDPAYDVVFAELNRRKAVVYTHPNGNACCMNLNLPTIASQDIEYGTDTTRAIANYIYSGAAAKFPDVKIIWSHAGGTMTSVIERFDVRDQQPPYRGKTEPFREQIKRFYFDTAQAANPTALGALRSLIPASQILYGSDYPYRQMTQQAAALVAAKMFSPDELRMVFAGNATRLMPRLA